MLLRPLPLLRHPCGDYTAYSFRQRQRTDLIAAVQHWAHFKAKAAKNRAEDLAAFRLMNRPRIAA